VGDLSALQSPPDVQEALDTGHRENDGVGAVRQVPRARLASRMNDLGGEESLGKVTTRNDVVIEPLLSKGGKWGKLRGGWPKKAV
jgi:hypothetical protein